MNNEDFDKFVETLQEKIDAKDREDFSKYALELANNPYHYGPMKKTENVYSAEWRGPCGDSISIYLLVENEIITHASFEVDGCVTSIIAGSQTAKMIEDKSIAEADQLKDSDVLLKLGKFPAESHHCCTLAVTTLKKAIEVYKKQNTKFPP